jgi:hypothetical protein
MLMACTNRSWNRAPDPVSAVRRTSGWAMQISSFGYASREFDRGREIRTLVPFPSVLSISSDPP